MTFWKSSVAPFSTVVPAAVVPSALLEVRASVPSFTRVAPVKRLLRESVTVSVVVLVMPTLPPRIASTVPDRRSKLVSEVSIPLVPVIVPEANCTPATVSSKLPMLKVPPLTTRFEALSRRSLAPSASVPALTVVVPV